MKEVLITNGEANQRLDKFLFKYFNAASRSFIYKMLRKKRIKLNRKKAEGSEILTEGDSIGFYLAPETMEVMMAERERPPHAKAPDIVYEDENILILNKPAGLLSHPESKDSEDTLIGRALYYLYEQQEYCSAKDSTFVPALCNRLDRNTSGLVLCGKNLASVQEMNRLIAQRSIDKFYVTIVKGMVTKPGTLTGTHRKDEAANKAAITDELGGKEAITAYEPIQWSRDITLLRVKLITGKTHQIRAHLASIEHPVLGDPKYGDRELNERLKKEYGVNRQLLHSDTIVFHVETGPLRYLDGRAFHTKPDGLFARVRDAHIKKP